MKVAHVVVLRRLEIYIVNLPTHGTIAPAGHALLEHVVWHVDEHRNDRVPLLGRKFFQTRCLCRCTRKAVENVTVLAVVLGRTFLDDANCQLIWNELSSFHYVSEFLRQRSVRCFECTKNISGGDLRQIQTLLKQARLRALSGTRRPHQHNNFRHTGSGSSSAQTAASAEEAFVVPHDELRLHMS